MKPQQHQDRLDGRCCQYCNTYFAQSHGEHTLCKACHSGLGEEEQGRRPVASHEEVKSPLYAV